MPLDPAELGAGWLSWIWNRPGLASSVLSLISVIRAWGGSLSTMSICTGLMFSALKRLSLLEELSCNWLVVISSTVLSSTAQSPTVWIVDQLSGVKTRVSPRPMLRSLMVNWLSLGTRLTVTSAVGWAVRLRFTKPLPALLMLVCCSSTRRLALSLSLTWNGSLGRLSSSIA